MPPDRLLDLLVQRVGMCFIETDCRQHFRPKLGERHAVAGRGRGLHFLVERLGSRKHLRVYAFLDIYAFAGEQAARHPARRSPA